MKNAGIFVALFTFFGSYAQDNINYKVMWDRPADVCNAYLNLELLEFEMPIKNISGMSFCLGGSVYVNYNNKFGADLLYRNGWLNLMGVTRRQFELGGFYNLNTRTKVRNQRVILDQDTWTSGSTEYTETKFIKCPATNMRSFGVRGGFLTNVEAYRDDRDGGLEGTYAYKWSGFYAGVLLTSQMNFRINTDKFGEAGAGFVRRFYADACIHPFASLTDIESETKNTTVKIGRLGFRVGCEAMPAERRKMKQAPIYIRVEAGMRPIDGIYMLGSFGINIKRKIPKLGVQEVVRENE